MSVYLSILKQWIIDPIQDSIVVPIFNPSTQTLLLLPLVLPILNHFTTNPIKTLLLLPIILPILNQWITDPLQNYIILPIFNLLTTDPIKKFLLLPLIAFVVKQINNDLFKFVYNHLLKCIFVPIKTHICYPFRCDSYVEKLNKQIEKLKVKRDSLEQSVVKAERNGEQIHDKVTQWLSTTTDEISEADRLIQGKEEATKKKCFFGLCPNLTSRHHLSEEVDKKTSAIDRLRNQEGLESISYRPPLQQIVEPSVYSREALPSRVLILNQVMDALKDPNLYIIGVYGLGGVGKTTLAKEVHGKSVEENMFETVVMVPVSQTPDLRKIQEDIADFVGLKFSAHGVAGRASQLKERLKKSKVLIILDDIWTKLELNDVGIPLGDECKGSKLLLTSRSHDVLSRQMGTQKEFPLEVLGEEETWSLFQMAVAAANNPELLDIAIKVAKKCSGLPLLVNIVAADLKNKELCAWKDVLVQLSDVDDEEIHGNVHKVLKSSYENLPSNEVKSLFLLCSLFGQSNIPINRLLTYAMGLGLFKNIFSVQGARDRLCRRIEKLKAESWLQDGDTNGGSWLPDGDTNGYVKMHDVVRDFARSIATTDQHAFFGITGNGSRQLWPEDENCTRIVLHHCDIFEFPEGLKYPNAELLSVVTEDLNLVVSDLFFEGIRKLRVLNLTGMCLVPMPLSLQSLINLNSLYMHQCRLKDVAIIGSLKQLEFLSFEKSDIVELPRQLGELTQLKSLNLSDCSELKVIPPNILPKLSLIEELYMNRSFDKWDENSNASLMELEELRQLTTLEVGVSRPKKLPNRLFSKGLERYKILIGCDYYWRTDKGSRTLMLTLKTNIHLEDGLQKLLRGSEYLHLGEFEGMENDLYDLNEEGFPKLKHLLIQDSKAIRHIMDSTMWVSCDAFPILETLCLFELSSLEEICHGGLGTESFRKLRTLNISGCNKLKKLFSFSTAKNLLQLQEINVSDCDNLEAFIAEGSEDGIRSPTKTEMISFPNLTILKVEGCKSLKYIFKTSTVKSLLQPKRLVIFDCELVEEIVLTEDFEAEEKTDKILFSKLDFLQLSGLPNLIRFIGNNSNIGPPDNVQSLFNEMAIFPNLQKMNISRMDNLEYIWHGQFADDDSFCKLKSLKIKECSKLKVVFATSNVMRRLQRLEELELWGCSKTEVIYPMDELDGIDEVAFELRHLKIQSMKSLKRIWSEDANGVFTFPNLKSVKVDWCGALEYVFPESIASGLLQLEELKVEWCNVEYVVGNTKSGEPYNFKWPKFKHFQLIRNRQKANQLLPWLAKVCPNLETLDLDGINWMNLQLSEFPKGSFSKLKVVELRSLDDVKTCVEFYGFLALLCSLKKLVLSYSDLGEVFLLDNERAVGRSILSTIIRLECLELKGLDSLKYIWKDDSFLPSEYLKTLEVSLCDSMIKIAASSISFQNLTTLHISMCNKLESLITPSTAKTMEHLTELRVECCKMMAEIVADDGDDAAEHEIIFKQLKSLKLIGLSNLNSFCSRINCTFHFPSLEQLFIQGCTGLLTIFSRGDFTTPKLQGVRTSKYSGEQHWEGNLNATVASIFTKQELLNIRGSSSSKAISPIQLQLIHNIKMLNVTDSDKVRAVFDLEAESFAGLLPQLQELRLIDLPMLTQLWNKDPTRILDFSQLGVLELDKCSNLKYAFTSLVASCLIQLRQLEVKNCEKMETIIKAEKAEEREALANKMILPSLESVALKRLPKLSSLYSGIGIMECPSLKQISITDCPNLKDFISSLSRTQNPTNDEGRNQIQEIHQDAPNLEMLELQGINWMKIQLECLELSRLGFLKYIWKEGSFVHFEYLKTLEVSYCRSLIKIAASSISFHNLTTLHIWGCEKLENLITTSTAKTMEHLTELRVEYCEMMAEIVAEDGDDAAEHEIIFKQLKSLELIWLSNLNSFCSRINCTFHFPSLEQLLIKGCTGFLTIFSPGDLTTPKLQGVRTSEYSGEQHWEGNLNATIESIFTKQKELNIKGSSSSKAISPIQLQLIHNIKRINVTDSDKVRVVFDLEAESFAGLLPQLQKLRLIDLPMLTQLWNKDPTGILDFSQLGVLELDKCSGLKYAFTSSVASCLIQLRQLEVKNCQMMETIVKAEERGALTNKMILPSLESVGLNCLPKLSNVYSGIGILECPSLKKISLTDCPNLKDSISSPSRAQNPTDDEGRNKIQEIHQDCKMFKILTLFCNPEKRNKIAITSLEELMIDWNLIKCIFDGNNQPYFLSKLKTLGLRGFHGECGVFSLESFPNMEGLFLSDSLAEEIIIPDLNVSKDKHLVDSNDPQTASIFQNLKEFGVFEYGRLKILVPSSVCFKILTYLKVSKCDGMINLITASTAKSLVLLRTMIISKCKVMQEIVGVETDGREDVIGFDQLECLKLKDLPSLTCFCSGNYAFDFPNLNDMTIIRCPNMKTFSQQVLTPKLSDVETSDDYEWKGSLNNTIQKLFMNGRDEKATDGGGEDEADPKETKAEGKNEEKDGEAYVKQRDETKEGEINEEKDGEGRRKKRRKIS